MRKIAFLGTGTMGMPMAHNLLRSDFQLRAWNRSLDRARPLADEGAELLEDPREAAHGAEVLITMLSDADAVLSVSEQAGAFSGPLAGSHLRQGEHGVRALEGRTMVALLVLLLILAIFGGLGFVAHFLWFILIAAVILWLIGFFVGGLEGGRRRWYGRW